MALFGRRANQQSNMTDVPPELQPYYRQETAGARARRIALTVVPILIVLLLIGGAVWGIAWLNRHKPATPHPSSNNQTAQNNQPQSSNNSSQGGGSGSNQNGSSSSQSPSTQSQGSSGSSTQNPSGSSNTHNPATGTIPNSGPDASVVALVAATSAGGAAMYHARQLRHIRNRN